MIWVSSLGTATGDGPRQRLRRGVDAHVLFKLGFAGLVGGRGDLGVSTHSDFLPYVNPVIPNLGGYRQCHNI